MLEDVTQTVIGKDDQDLLYLINTNILSRVTFRS